MLLLLLGSKPLCAADIWSIRAEEPTGLYRRTGEIVRVPLAKIGGESGAFIVLDGEKRELPWQVGDGVLMFPASLIPGELPIYKVARVENSGGERFTNGILLRKTGLQRIELGNSRFRVVIDTGVPAMVEAYSLAAGPQRQLNLVETTPENEEDLKNDIHKPEAPASLSSRDNEGRNTGWTTLGGKGPMTEVILAETGPLRGRLVLKREHETWELSWTSDSPALRWKASKGFRFDAISAQPFLPFDRCVDGSEYFWPTGPGEDEPSDHAIAPRQWPKLPGGHIVYYQRAANYGALGIVALDAELNWKGAGSRHVQAEKSDGETEIAITFPAWKGIETVLEARREFRILRQPLLCDVSGPKEGAIFVATPAEREPAAKIQKVESAPKPFEADSLSLDGEWELAWAEKGGGRPQSGWRKVKVPGSVHTQWLAPEKIYGHEAEWLSGKEWWYRKTFPMPDRFAGKRLRLQFEATDYYADVWMNDQFLGRHEGYIDPYAFEVADFVRPNTGNELVVRVWTPVDYYWKHRPYTVKGSYGAVDQKPDDITPLGITRSVRLAAAAPTVIEDIAIATRLTESGAEVEAQLEADGAPVDSCFWELTLSPRNFSSPDIYRLRVPASGRSIRCVIPVTDPQLWWTWDHGKPNLYTLDARLLDASGHVLDGRSLAVGIREIEKVGWTFYLNRKRLFIRGTNYYFNLYLSEMNRAAYERDLRLMLQMNVNMIRLHCHFTNREFYDLADENGVLLWQDFLEAWYPHDTDFSLRAAALYDPLIRYTRNHTSIAIWATSDEEDLENYRDLTKHLAPRPAMLDPQRRPVVRSTGRYGDAHVYHGWYDGTLWDYKQMDEQFVTELGATALPNYETLTQFLPNHWPIKDNAPEWMFRRLQIDEALRAWGDPAGKTLKEYIPQTQAYVSRLFQIALERMRQHKYRDAGGIFHFHAIDIWPSVTMAAIDFNRIPTKVFDTVRRSFAPVAATFDYDRDRWRTGEDFRCDIWAINDRWEAFPDAAVRWRILDANGTSESEGAWPLSLAADSAVKLGAVQWKAAAPGRHKLTAEVVDKAGEQVSENIFEFTIDGVN
jgi:beta-mannosidase